METNDYIPYIGILIMAFGLLLVLNFGGNQGFSAGILPGLAYISGFVIAFIGAYLAFLYGRKRSEDKD